MERFTIFNPNKTAIGTQYGMIQSVIDDCRLGEVIDKLGGYEDTGLTPEEIKEDIRVHTEQWKAKLKETENECEYWHRQALTYSAQIGEIRIWLAQLGCTPEKVLEDCKTMFPDKAVNKDE